MAKDWKNELKEIITSQQSNIKKVIDNRDKRETDRLKKINEIKDIIRPRLEFIKELIEKDKYLISSSGEEEKLEQPRGAVSRRSKQQTEEPEMNMVPTITISNKVEDERTLFIESVKRGEAAGAPKIKDGPAEIVLIMPQLSDINRLDLMYQIEFRDEKPILHAYDLLPAGKMKNNGSAHDKFEDFVQDTLKRFLLSWFTRKEGTELDKERTFKLIVESHGLK